MSIHTHAVRLLGAIALAISLAACDSATPPTQPPPPPPPSPPGPRGETVSGVVLEFTATGEVRPVPNLRLKVRAGSLDGAVGGAQLADTVTDANGRYTVTDVSAYVLFFQTAPVF